MIEIFILGLLLGFVIGGHVSMYIFTRTDDV